MGQRSLPSIAFLAGLAGYILRRRELVDAFNPETGLATLDQPVTWLLIALSAGLLLALLLAVRPLTAPSDDWGARAFAAPGGLYLAAVFLAAGVLLVACALGVRDCFAAERMPVLRLVLFLSALPAAGGMAAIGLRNHRGAGRQFSFPLLLPAYFVCIWLIAANQAHSADPVHLGYVYPTFAIISAVLATYFMAGFSFEQPKAKRYLCAALMCLFFSMVSLADNSPPLPDTLFFIAIPLYLFIHAWVLLQNLGRTPQTDSVTEENTHE